MGQEGRGIGALDDLCRRFERSLRIAVLPQQSGRFGIEFGHPGSVSAGAFQAAGHIHFLRAAPALHVFGIAGNSLPLQFQRFFGLHHFPGGIAHHHYFFIEGLGIAPLFFVAVVINFHGKDVLDARHGLGGGVVHRFEFQTECRRMHEHGDEHAFAVVVEAKERLSGDDFAAVHVFARGADDFEILEVFQFHLFGYGQGGGGRSHLAITG